MLAVVRGVGTILAMLGGVVVWVVVVAAVLAFAIAPSLLIQALLDHA